MGQAGIMPKSAVVRTACINIWDLPLQILLRNHPEWCKKPVAVVEEEQPLSPILWLNAAAIRAGIKPGLRDSSALSLDQGMCAGTISDQEIHFTIQNIHMVLDHFSPCVEPSREDPGIFWLDASGLNLLYSSLKNWASQIQSSILRLELKASIVVGFSRFGTYAIAKGKKAMVVMPTMEVENYESNRVHLQHFQLHSKLKKQLIKLAIHTVDDFLALPQESIVQHLGKQARDFYHFAMNEQSLPLQPQKLPESFQAQIELSRNESNSQSLLLRTSQLLIPLLNKIGNKGQVVVALRLEFRCENGTRCDHRIQAAEPTLNAKILLELVGLILETITFIFPVVELYLEAEGVCFTDKKRSLFRENPIRDKSSAMRALARVRVEFGTNSVLIAQLKKGHLPEARFEWYRFDRLTIAKPRSVSIRYLIRRTYTHPRAVGDLLLKYPPSPISSHEYLINGGWWCREIRRNYRFVDTRKGETLWVYYDHRKHSWFVQGCVE